MGSLRASLLTRLSQSLPDDLSAGLVLAVSGGVDSMVMLDLFHHLALDSSPALLAVTVDHGLRDFSRERSMLEVWCRERSIPWTLVSLEPGLERRSGTRSLEEVAREERYQALQHHRPDSGWIVTAHTLDDQAETLLLRLLRGAGLRGLASIAPVRGDRVLRPLLSISRKEINAYQAEYRIPFVEDPSNGSDRHLRNRIRSRVLPLLEEISPSAGRVLARDAEVLREEGQALDLLLEPLLVQVKGSRGGLELPLAILEPGPLGRILIHRSLDRVGLSRALSRLHIQALQDLALGSRAGELHLPGGLRARVEQGRLLIRAAGEDKVEFPDVRISGPGIHELGWATLEVTWDRRGDRSRLDPARIIQVDPASAPFPWSLRGFNSGERLCPMGLDGSRKISDILIDAKVPRRFRSLPLVLEDAAGKVIWLIRGRRTAHALVPETGDHALTVGIHFSEDWW